MRPVPVGTRVKVIDAGPFDDLVTGTEVIVQVVDNDGTFRGRDPRSGRVGGWLRWQQVEPAFELIGIAFLKTHLSAEAARLLLAFNGTENLRLKSEVCDRILLGLPDLGQLVREEAGRLGAAAPRLKTRQPHAKSASSPSRLSDEEAELSALLEDEPDEIEEEE